MAQEDDSSHALYHSLRDLLAALQVSLGSVLAATAAITSTAQQQLDAAKQQAAELARSNQAIGSQLHKAQSLCTEANAELACVQV